MEFITIQYCFTLSDGSDKRFSLQLNPKTLNLIIQSTDQQPSWTKLDYHQCPHCPLTLHLHSNCPLAVSLVDIVKHCEDLLSFDQIDLQVITEEREISQKTTAQKGISSLMGVLMASSGCPYMSFFKPMARFHLPLSSKEETIYRATSMYLLAQYFLKNEGKPADFKLEGLRKIYKNIQIVNTCVAKRLGECISTDSPLNAIVLLDLHARALPSVIEESLNEIRYMFTPFFEN